MKKSYAWREDKNMINNKMRIENFKLYPHFYFMACTLYLKTRIYTIIIMYKSLYGVSK